jgi:hypothetical protein
MLHHIHSLAYPYEVILMRLSDLDKRGYGVATACCECIHVLVEVGGARSNA